MSHSTTRANRTHEIVEQLTVRDADRREQRPEDRPDDRPVVRSSVGWRYGSALAAARALNARPVEV